MTEVICYFFLTHSSNPLYRARRILQYDEALAWMQMPNLDTTFEDNPVMTDLFGFRTSKEAQNIKAQEGLLTLGPSSAFGWGVSNNDTYTTIVAKNLNLSPLNASGIGHSIFQGKIMWDRVKLTQNSHYALIAYGVNDLDKFRFFDSEPLTDKDYFKNGPSVLALDKRQSRSDFLIALSLLIRQTKHNSDCSKLIGITQRVSWDDYKNILDSMILEMDKMKITPIIINTPFYLKKKNPHFEMKQITNFYNEAGELAKEGKCSEAQEKLKQAKSLEPFSIYENVVLFNERLKLYAHEKKILYIDSFELLINQDAADHFYDPVHPSAKGHKIIADEILRKLK